MPNKNDALRAFACYIDYMYFFDENTTVNGTVGILDAGNYTMKLHGYISLEERRDFMQTWQVRTTNKHVTLTYFWHFYRAMLRRARLCHSKSSVRPSVCGVEV